MNSLLTISTHQTAGRVPLGLSKAAARQWIVFWQYRPTRLPREYH